MTVEDILARRTRILFLDAKAAMNAAPFVATVMAAHLQKNETWIAQQVDSFIHLAKAYIPLEALK